MRRCLSPRIFSSGFLRMKSSATSTENSPLRLSSKSLPPVRRRIVERELRDFRLSGASLPKVQRERVKAIGQELSQTSQKFSENLLDATNAYELLIEDEKRLAGIPEETLASIGRVPKLPGKRAFA